MTVRVRKYKRGGWEVDIQFRWPEDMTEFRRRLRAPVNGKAAAQRWGEAREAAFLRAGKAPLKTPEKKEVPTLAEFQERFIQGYCKANRQKPSGIAGKETVFRVHLIPRLGKKRLDLITNEDIQSLKAALSKKSPKTVNNVLTTLSKCLKVAAEWGVIEELPCIIRLLKVSSEVPGWYELLEYKRLCEAAQKLDPRIHIMVLLAGSAGLRRGEIIALQWSDLDLRRRLIKVQRSIWNGHETVPKGGKGRIVRMTSTLADALTKHRHLQGSRVLYQDDGRELLTNKTVRLWLGKAQQRAGIEVTGAIHRLRHTFCSLLAAEGAPPRAIQELAGHAHISTTMKYMHLSPATLDGAIHLLDKAWDRAEEEINSLETRVETGAR
jgi:integrase